MPKFEMSSVQIPVACFAPPLTDELLAKYEGLAAGLATSPLKDALLECLTPVKLWWDLPESKADPDKPKLRILHRGEAASVAVRDLEPEFAAALFEAIPWDHEIEGIERLFDAIPVEQKALRDAAFHLLWHVKELNLDREPLTQAALPGGPAATV